MPSGEDPFTRQVSREASEPAENGRAPNLLGEGVLPRVHVDSLCIKDFLAMKIRACIINLFV